MQAYARVPEVDLTSAQAGAELESVPSVERAITPLGEVAKHTVDFVLVLIGVTLLLPLLAVVAALIKLDSPGPVFFRQRRAGRNGTFFRIFKFRTMVDGAYMMGSRLTTKRDPRITRVGQYLRWTKLDELPQLFNVLRGEMSLIGPRPEDPHFVEHYTPLQRNVLRARPGIVGPSQILGRDEAEDYPDGLRDTERYYIERILPEKLERDLEYVRTGTFWGDIWLLLHGLWATVFGTFRFEYLWRRRRRLAVMAADLVLCIAAYLVAILIRFDWGMPEAAWTWQALALTAVVMPPALAYFGAYQGILSYFGLWDLLQLAKGVTAGAVAVAAFTYLTGMQQHPRSVFVIDWAVMFLALATLRYVLRSWARGRARAHAARRKAIVVGAGTGGEHLLRALIGDPTSEYHVTACIDESPERWGSRIHGVKVLGGAAELRLALSANGAQVVFVCLSDVDLATAREIAEICAGAGVDCRLLPALSELLNTESFTVERPSLRAPGSEARCEA